MIVPLRRITTPPSNCFDSSASPTYSELISRSWYHSRGRCLSGRKKGRVVPVKSAGELREFDARQN